MVEECWRTYPTWQVKTHEIVTPKMIRDVSEVEIESMRQNIPSLTMQTILNIIEFIMQGH